MADIIQFKPKLNPYVFDMGHLDTLATEISTLKRYHEFMSTLSRRAIAVHHAIIFILLGMEIYFRFFSGVTPDGDLIVGYMPEFIAAITVVLILVNFQLISIATYHVSAIRFFNGTTTDLHNLRAVLDSFEQEDNENEGIKTILFSSFFTSISGSAYTVHIDTPFLMIANKLEERRNKRAKKDDNVSQNA